MVDGITSRSPNRPGPKRESSFFQCSGPGLLADHKNKLVERPIEKWTTFTTIAIHYLNLYYMI